MRRVLALVLLLGVARADLPPIHVAQLDRLATTQTEEPAIPEAVGRKRLAIAVAVAAVATGTALTIVGASATERTLYYGRTVSRPNTLAMVGGIGIDLAGIIVAVALWPRE